MKISLWLLSLSLCGCVQKMGTEGHLRPLEVALAGSPPAGTVPQTEPRMGPPPTGLPKPLTRAFLEKGQEQFSISCQPCHGPSGNGDGMVVQRGFLAPPSFHIDRLRAAPDQHFFDVITRGYGAMYSYSDRVLEPDRWAVVAYIRALQLSQNAKWEALAPEDRERLKKEVGP